MESLESTGVKRKRSPSEIMVQPRHAPPPPPPTSGTVTQINYLMRARHDKLKLFEGETETLGELLSLIDEYEGVLQRHESMAANLGAKLVGPLLLKTFEKLFENPIKIVQATYAQDGTTVNWLDIVDFAHTKPQEFILTDSKDGTKVCQFWIKQCKVEISEDDWRLIISGAPERMIPAQPIPEDEASELGTMEILEGKLSHLIKKADAVAGRARQLNYHLKGRKNAIQNRRAATIASAANPDNANNQSGETSRAASHGAYPQSPQPANYTTVASRSNNSEPATYSSPSPGLQQELLRQFMGSPVPESHRNTQGPSRSKANRTAPPSTQLHNAIFVQSNPGQARRRPSQTPSGGPGETSHTPNSSTNEGPYKASMVAKVEKLNKGDDIWPPCDRCRRLRMQCTKHLTACHGCTKKHCKCQWRDIEPGEAAYLDVLAVGGAAQPASQVPQTMGELSQATTMSEHPVTIHDDHNLDPGLRNAGGLGILGQSVEDGEANKREDNRSDAEILSHMAVAAAAGGQQ